MYSFNSTPSAVNTKLWKTVFSGALSDGCVTVHDDAAMFAPVMPLLSHPQHFSGIIKNRGDMYRALPLNYLAFSYACDSNWYTQLYICHSIILWIFCSPQLRPTRPLIYICWARLRVEMLSIFSKEY